MVEALAERRIAEQVSKDDIKGAKCRICRRAGEPAYIFLITLKNGPMPDRMKAILCRKCSAAVAKQFLAYIKSDE